jgi:hypothetical protein
MGVTRGLQGQSEWCFVAKEDSTYYFETVLHSHNPACVRSCINLSSNQHMHKGREPMMLSLLQ